MDGLLPTRHRPRRIAPDTWLVRQTLAEGPVALALNSLVVLGAEPVLVDTGATAGRRAWLDDIWTILDPADIRWIFLTHDDPDHSGNLAAALAQSPDATVVTNRRLVSRLAALKTVAPERLRAVRDGESLTLGDRVFVVVRPPVHDSLETCGLFDTSTGVYWGADCFATPVPAGAQVDDVSELASPEWQEGSSILQSLLAPWTRSADLGAWSRCVTRVERLDPAAVVGAHGPVVRGPQLADAFGVLRALPAAPAPVTPDALVYDSLLERVGTAPTTAVAALTLQG